MNIPINRQIRIASFEMLQSKNRPRIRAQRPRKPLERPPTLDSGFMYAQSGFGAILCDLGPVFGPVGSTYIKIDPGFALSVLENP